MLSIVLYTISQMHVNMDMVSLAISDCLMKVVKYIVPCRQQNLESLPLFQSQGLK